MSTPDTRGPHHAPPADADVIYFLMWPGWETELVGNRWHFALRWARHVPVVLVQPTLLQATPDMSVEREQRFANCEILRIRSSGGRPVVVETSLIQTAQILAHLRARGYERPLLWCYNATLVGAYAALPAVGRVFHATENYFNNSWFHGVGGPFFERQLCAAYEASDLIVAVSSGLAEAIADEAHVYPEVVTNGCDFDLYANGVPDAELVAAGSRFDRVAIFAGNISQKFDFDLALRAVGEHPSTLFALYGPIADLNHHDERTWNELKRRHNVRYGGVVSPAQLSALYAAADVGLIPYRQDPLIVVNGFPLKTFEMAATGLPVVSTLMRPIVGLADGISVTDSPDRFLAKLGELSRDTLSAEQREELITISAENDYDRKFDRVLELLEDRIPLSRPRTCLDSIISALGVDAWYEICDVLRRDDAENRHSRLRLTRRSRMLRAVHKSFPASLRRWVPAGLRQAARRGMVRGGEGSS